MKKETKKQTHMSQVREADLGNMFQVCELLGWTQDQYCEHQLEQYTKFLKLALAAMPTYIQNKAAYSPVLRGFWNNEWFSRNEREFLPMAIDYLRHSNSYVYEDGTHYLCWDNTEFINLVADEYLKIHSMDELADDERFLIRFYNNLKIIDHA